MAGVSEAYAEVLRQVLALRDAETGVWTGELASSALGTALASAALRHGGADGDGALAAAGEGWLAAHVNADGGWGDTPESVSNLSTTLIARAALASAGHAAPGADAWIAARAGEATPEAVTRALGQVYGADRTFAVPILAFLAMCGGRAEAWRQVPPLPFLLALFPQGAYRFLRLHVVSYALPALIAVGLCRHVCAARSRGGWVWGRLFAGPLLRRLERLQPRHGGFLDAVPLTAFVCLALRHAGYGEHPVARRGLAFLRQAARADGSWAIDSNLRTWVTSLAARGVAGALDAAGREQVAGWLLRTQLKGRHPFTGARPGGWAWTDLPGGVPDADDTSGALVALRRLRDAGCAAAMEASVRSGIAWLLGVQNADGGMPTFCRGWGRLPFDRSCPDISAHALAALAAWRDVAPRGAGRAARRLGGYLARSQEADGSWVPLWFGHQEAAGGRNPVVGTARVVDALRGLGGWRDVPGVGAMLARGERWLAAAQRADGGWGAGAEATVEETALAVVALAGGGEACRAAAARGAGWLAARGGDGLGRAAPIGLYFALLWYHERMYPLVWALEALGACRASL